MPSVDADIAHHAALDARMVAAARGIRVLGLASWSPQVQQRFLADLAAGRRALPQIVYPPLDFGDNRREFAAIAAAADPAHPLGAYLVESTRAWDSAAQLLEALGTPAVTGHSIALYGRPDAPVPGGGLTICDAAQHFIGIADELDPGLLAAPMLGAPALQALLQADLDAYFDGRVIAVELDPDMIAKAAAGAYRLRLRADAQYSIHDRGQLLQHEAFVHSLTALNGREQTVLPSLAMASPRTTCTQEGLAVLAEQITGQIDIGRMKRISLRTLAIDQALRGADFLQVFDLFQAGGQDAPESFASAQRVFRGAPLTGGHAFTKDAVYLRGLIDVHTFFRQSLARRELARCRQLFAGKMTLADVQRFAPMFEAGMITPPRWLPPWMAHAGGLAGMLAFSLFANRIRLDRVLQSPVGLASPSAPA